GARDYFGGGGRLVSTGLSLVPVCVLFGWRGVQALALAGAPGSTPKSHTYKFICFLSSISTRAYSPGTRSSAGVTFIHSPIGVLLVLIQFSFWLTLPYTAIFRLPTIRLSFLGNMRIMRYQQGSCSDRFMDMIAVEYTITM